MPPVQVRVKRMPLSTLSNIPIPDPSVITQQLIDRNDAQLRSDYEERIDALANLLNGRLDAMDQAARVLAGSHNTMPTLLDREVSRLTGLFDEKLAGVDSISKEGITTINAVIGRLTISVSEAVAGARLEAATANDSLQRLLEQAMGASTKLADVRFDAQEVAIGKTETAVQTAMIAATGAVDTAKRSAEAALIEVNSKSIMRHDAAISATLASELKLGERMASLQQLIDLRAKMNETAIGKADEATEKRFRSISETQIAGIERQIRTDAETVQHTLNALSTRITQREVSETTKRDVRVDGSSSINNVAGIVGGSVAVLSLIAMLGFSVFNANRGSVLPPVPSENARRFDDLISRLDSLQRSSQLVVPVPPVGR